MASTRDLRHRRLVAIKVVHPDLGHALGAERFLREIEVVAGLAHPHILPLHDSGEAGGLLWFAMPYVEGETLRDRLRREGTLPVDDAVRLAAEVADALDYAHGRGVVHRDLKPANILLASGHALVAEGALLYNVACMYALQSDRERAIELLELAVAKGYRKPREWVEKDSDLDSLHGLARFTALLERL